MGLKSPCISLQIHILAQLTRVPPKNLEEFSERLTELLLEVHFSKKATNHLAIQVLSSLQHSSKKPLLLALRQAVNPNTQLSYATRAQVIGMLSKRVPDLKTLALESLRRLFVQNVYNQPTESDEQLQF